MGNITREISTNTRQTLRHATVQSRQVVTQWLLLSLLALTGAVWTTPGSATTPCPSVARVVSVEGEVASRPEDQSHWQPVVQGQRFCGGEIVRTGGASRVALALTNETIIRLNQHSSVVLPRPAVEMSWLSLLEGAIHFITRVPRALTVETPYLNAAVEGTEFTVALTTDEAQVSVVEGHVRVTNPLGALLLADGESASARAGEAPLRRLDLSPTDAVRWSLYYPSLIAPGMLGGQASLDPRIVEADRLLGVGQVDAALGLLRAVREQRPDDVAALALWSIIALTQNAPDEALRLAQRAVALDPAAPAAAMALSSVQQAQFELVAAHETLQAALQWAPDNSLLLARLAELLLSLDDLEAATVMAQRALGLDPEQAHALTMLGFAQLGQFEVTRARGYFTRAMALNQADPLPRLGLGLALIRDGQLTEGRREIEIAATLNPSNALIRSYLGKAYYEEKRDTLAADQFLLARALDPNDPTPWFYDAIRKQTLNRPVEALHDLQQSIRLNDNRAVYRSRLRLDQDDAARGASLARIYHDLGFEQLALAEGWKSVSTDPANHSAHRLLADAYAALPRHEIARVSELLQAQLLQPLNLNPIQPQLAESSLGLLDGDGPTRASANEFNPLFTRNRFSLQLNGVAANQSSTLEPERDHTTRSVDLVHAAVWGRYSYSLGTFHDDNQGIRPNHDRDREIDNAFFQTALSHRTSLQLEYRNTQTEEGDLPLRYDPLLFSMNKRTYIDRKVLRFGLRHDFAPGNLLLFSAIKEDFDEYSRESGIISFPFPFGDTPFTRDGGASIPGQTFELQHQLNRKNYRLLSGGSSYRSSSKININMNFDTPFCPPFCPIMFETYSKTRHHIGYLYTYLQRKQWHWTLGLSVDDLNAESTFKDDTQINPKLGLIWQPNDTTTLRAAAFRTLKRAITNNQTLEPTHVAGFNQFYDDITGTEGRRYGIALEKKYNKIDVGVELSQRDLTTYFYDLTIPAAVEPDWQELTHRAYFYWTPFNWLAARTEYQFESIERVPGYDVTHQDSAVGITTLKTHQLPIGINLFSAKGITTTLTTTRIDQEGTFYYRENSISEHHADAFWLVDAAISYRLKQRKGRITIGAKNLLDKEFRYHNIDYATNRISPDRTLFTRLSLSF